MEKEARWSAGKKREVILRLLGGESAEVISREIKVPVPELLSWQRDFIEAGTEGLKRQGKKLEARRLERAEKTIGKLLMELELHKKKENYRKRTNGDS